MRRYLLSSVSAIALSAPMQLETWVRAQLVQANIWLHRQARGKAPAKHQVEAVAREIDGASLGECYRALGQINRALFPA